MVPFAPLMILRRMDGRVLAEGMYRISSGNCAVMKEAMVEFEMI